MNQRVAIRRRVGRGALIGSTVAAFFCALLSAQPMATVLRGRVATATATMTGEVMFVGDTVTCVAATCAAPPGARTIDVGDAFIYPGFIDAHNHVAYNVLPKFTPPQVYTNRSQWQGAPAYLTFKRPYERLKDHDHLFCEMVKYGEIRALLSGITTIEGTSPSDGCYGVLVRNVENQNGLGLPAHHVRTWVLPISGFDDTIDWTRTKSFVVHLAEGTDASARSEFTVLKDKHLLRSGTAIIHATAFQDADFAEIATAGASLIWSPQSNLALYHQTTNVRAALAHGVNVSVGVDWNPTGSDTIFDELRVADAVNTSTFDRAIPASDWLPMITTHPAKALAVDDRVGTLAPGFKADITVIARHDPDPSVNLLRTHLEDVQTVWIGGRVLYGDASIVESVRPHGCEAFLMHGVDKRVCVADAMSTVPKHAQTLAALRQTLVRHYAQLAPLTR